MSALSQLITNSNAEINLGPYDSGNSEYTGSLRINGNLQVNGNITYVDQLNVNDAFIQVAANNTGTVTDMGLVATINANAFAGLRWDTTVGSWQTSTSVTANGEPVNVYTNVVSGPPAGPASNTQVIFADGPYDLGSSPNFTFDKAVNLLTVLGNSSVSGNVIAGNVSTAGLITATGNITVGNVDTAGLITATGNVTGGNFVTVGQITATGNISTANYFVGNGAYVSNVFAIGANADTLQGQTLSSNVIYSSLTTVGTLTSLSVSGNTDSGNLRTAGQVTATGNITGGNLLTGGLISSTGNITSGNVLTGGLISATGNITGGNVQATNYTGTTASMSGNITGGNIATGGALDVTGNSNVGNLGTLGSISAAGNVTGGNILTTGILSTSGNIGAGNVNTPSVIGSNLTLTASSGNLNLSSAGNIVVNNVYVNNLKDPIQDQDAATKNYVDNAVSAGLEIHQSVLNDIDNNISATYVNGGTTPTWTTITGGNTVTTGSAHGLSVNDVIVFGSTTNGLVAGTPYFVYSTPTTTSITLSDNYNGLEITTLTNGTGLSITSLANSGVGATLTSTTNGPLVIEGYTSVLNDRVLVVGQTDATQNGVYYVSQAGVAGGGGSPWILTRASDGNKYGQNSTTVLDQGSYFLVTGGDDQGEAYVMTTSGTIVFGTTNIVFAQFSKITPYTAGTGLTLTSFQFSVNADQSQITNVGTLGNLSVAGNTTTGNLLTGGLISATGSITGGGNITGGNILTTGLISATGNLTSGNVNTVGLVTATGNVTGGNINTAGLITATGNVTVGNLLTGGTMSAAGNVNGLYYFGDGSFLTNVQLAGLQIVNGTSNVKIPSANSNIYMSVDGTANVVIVSNNAVAVSGTISSSGNISSAGNIIGGNVLGGANVNATTHTGVTVSVSANVTGGNLLTNGLVSAGGNITTGGALNAANLSLSGNVLSAINSTSNINTTGNITGAYLFGNLTALNNGNSNIQIGTANGNGNVSIGGTSNIVVWTTTGEYVTGVVSSSGNVIAGNVTTAGVVTATGNVIGGNITTAGQVSATGNITGGNITTAGALTAGSYSTAGNVTAGNVNTGGILSATGNVYGYNFISSRTTGATLNIIGSAPATANTQGGAIVISAGNATSQGTSSTGGAVNINAGWGDGGNANLGIGGSIAITSGQGTAGGRGGSITLRGGNSNSLIGGLLLMTGANTDGLGTAGNVRLDGGSVLDGLDLQGGSLTLSAGPGTGAGAVSKVVIRAPSATVSGNSTQSSANIAVFESTKVSIAPTTNATSTGTGALVVSGGVGVAGNIFAGGLISAAGNILTSGIISAVGNITGGNLSGTNLTGTLLTAAQTNITSVGTLSSLSVTGNIAAGNLSATNLSGTLTTASQTNITSVGTLSTLSVSGNITGANVNTSIMSASGNVYGANVVGIIRPTSGTGVNGIIFPADPGGGSGDLATIQYYAAAGEATVLELAVTNDADDIIKLNATGGVSVVGNITSGNVIASGLLSTNSITHTGTNATGDIGSNSSWFNTVYAANIVGTASKALYADVAERYQADKFYWPGTVVIFGGEKEVTQSTESHDTRIAGVVSTDPAYLMNSGDTRENSTNVALLGRVPCSVVGSISKGDQLVSSDIPGVATKYNIDHYNPGMIIGKALADYNSESPGVIEVVIGRL